MQHLPSALAACPAVCGFPSPFSPDVSRSAELSPCIRGPSGTSSGACILPTLFNVSAGESRQKHRHWNCFAPGAACRLARVSSWAGAASLRRDPLLCRQSTCWGGTDSSLCKEPEKLTRWSAGWVGLLSRGSGTIFLEVSLVPSESSGSS